jgi:Autotransporter beta-domain
VLPDTPVFAPRAGGTASLFAALDTAASPFDAFNSFPQCALGYAEATKAPALKAASAVYADGNAVWAKGFGGQRVQDSNGAFIGGTTTGAGGAVGYERVIDPDLKVGALVGGSTNKTNLYLNAGSTNTDTVFGGAYGRKMWGATFLDLAVIGGNLANTPIPMPATSAAGSAWSVPTPAMAAGSSTRRWRSAIASMSAFSATSPSRRR